MEAVRPAGEARPEPGALTALMVVMYQVGAFAALE
jgi:hypothetical protein